MNPNVLLAFLLPPAFVLGACGGSSSPAKGTPGIDATDGGSETDATGGSVTDGASTDVTVSSEAGSSGGASGDGASDGSVVCNTLVNGAPTKDTQEVASPAPVLTGGTIADGTYFLTDLTEYTGDAGMSGTGGSNSTTIEVDGTTIQLAMVGNSTATEMVTTSGSSFTDMRTCPAPATREGTYSATATTLTVQFQNGTADGGVNTIQETFTLQQ